MMQLKVMVCYEDLWSLWFFKQFLQVALSLVTTWGHSSLQNQLKAAEQIISYSSAYDLILYIYVSHGMLQFLSTDYMRAIMG